MITQLNFYEYLLFIILLICQPNFLSGNKSLEVPLTTLKLEESNPSQGSKNVNLSQGSKSGNLSQGSMDGNLSQGSRGEYLSQGSKSEHVGVCVRAMFGPYHNVKQLGKQIIWFINSRGTIPFINSEILPLVNIFKGEIFQHIVEINVE